MPSLLSDFDELCITQRDAFLQTVPCIDPLEFPPFDGHFH